MCVNESIVCVLLVYVECVVAAECKQVESPVLGTDLMLGFWYGEVVACA